MEACEDPQSQMARKSSLTPTHECEEPYYQSTPTRGPCPVGAYVYFFKTQVQPGAPRQYRWFGPGRVIGVELRNPRRLEDDDMPTEGGAPHSYWIRYGPSVVLATGEQMRFASEDELLAAHTVPHYAVAEDQTRGARSFVDVRPLGKLPDLQDMRELRQEAETPQRRSSSAYPLPPIPEQHEAEGPTPMIVQPQLHQPPEATIIQPPEPPVPEVPLDDVELAPEDDITRQLTVAEPEPQPAAAVSQHAVAQPLHAAIQQPDRLDGIGPVRRQRHDREPIPGPYLTEFQEAMSAWADTLHNIEESIQSLKLKRLTRDGATIEMIHLMKAARNLWQWKATQRLQMPS